jgi:hypothetical protein
MRMHIDLNRFEACPPYNEWLDRSHADGAGALDILGFRPRPSEILFAMSQDTYMAAFADFQREWEEELKDSVFNGFPSPIAYYFYRFESGFESELQRLHFLRDTWESIVDIAHAMAVSECRHRCLALADPLKYSDLMSDKVAQRLLNIERLLCFTADSGLSLKVAEVLPLETLKKMRDLNQNRNAFSHSAAQSEAQAAAWISECYADVIDVLDDIRRIAEVGIYRYRGHIDGNTLRCEVFRGHGLTRTIKAVSLDSAQVVSSQRYFQQGALLLSYDGDLFGLRPFVHSKEDPAGHTTKLCFFRRTHGDAPNRRVEYELVGDAVRVAEDRASFQPDIDALRALFGLGPE